ncbi:MAG: bifunctional phosphopantothenoylcysteine decarboxylase/phosphopantothenate--cysteine ligase CoaBC [Bacteroidota bacterium]
MVLKGKKIILGVTGSIAAYKSAFLTRLLVKEGAIVKVIMTPLAKEFITPVTMATLSRNTVLCDFFKYDDGTWNSHVDLGLWADLMLIAPATANTIAKMAYGICDNLLLTTYLSVRCPVVICPAMDSDMFKHPATESNIEIIKKHGVTIIEPSEGELASGLHGKGRMEEPEKVIAFLKNFFQTKKKIKGKKFLVTAGPTYEKIDPVRFIGNFSSGKMGFAIAEKLAEYGAKVHLIFGPTSLKSDNKNIQYTSITSAEEMYNEVMSSSCDKDCIIMAAAVADYCPVKQAQEKIKKTEKTISLYLEKTKDILFELGKSKKKNQLLIGFALETDHEIEHAKKKLKNKNLDFIILNSLNDKGAGFQYDSNKIMIIDKYNKIDNFELKSKNEVADDIINKIEKLIK